MRLLLVEDDEFKAQDIGRVLDENLPHHGYERATSVTSALRAISSAQFDLVILDMSLPTFDLSGPGGGGSPQGQGGVEVLRLAKRLKHRSSFVVITQYPDIEIDGSEIPLGLAADRLTRRFDLPVAACILYEFESEEWKGEMLYVLRSIEGGS